MGRVYLVGGGPGDPELLTVKAARILRKADVVLHDSLVGKGVLDLITPTANIIDVGKRCGTKLLSQDEINQLLVSYSRNAKCVVRLKGGDPTIFGRAAEEISALVAAQVEFEIVPGITAGMAAAAAAGISLTDRRLASHLVFTTAHRDSGKVEIFDPATPQDSTYVIYMPGSDYGQVSEALIGLGFRSETPCVLVSNVSGAGQKLLQTELSRLDRIDPLPAPTIMVVGRVAGNLAEHMASQFSILREPASKSPTA